MFLLAAAFLASDIIITDLECCFILTIFFLGGGGVGAGFGGGRLPKGDSSL
jgi:hypothetical protein